MFGLEISTIAKIVLAIIALLIVVFIGTLLIEHGSNTALEGVNRANEKAATNAESAALNYDDCMRAGRLWDYGAGKCGRIATNSGN